MNGKSAVIDARRNGEAPAGRGRLARSAPFELRVHVGPMLHELFDELEAAQVAGADRGRVAALFVAPARLAHPGERVERP